MKNWKACIRFQTCNILYIHISVIQSIIHTYIHTYIQTMCLSWIFNDRQLQSVISKFCGHYCIYYCMLRSMGFDMRKIVRSFSSDTGLNDALVHRFVCRRLCIWTAYILLLLIWTVTVSRGYLTIASYRALSVNSVDTTVCILLHASVLICVRLCVVLVVILDWMMR